MPRAKQRTPQMREHVLQAALELLGSDGIAQFTTRRLAGRAGTSTPAVYELFGDKAGLVREVFFEGFRMLGEQLEQGERTQDPKADLIAVTKSVRMFVREHPVLAELMFSRPLADFDPGPEDRQAGEGVRLFIVDAVKRCVRAGLLRGDATDIAHVILALVQGLAGQETAGWLGTSAESRDRRWELAVTGLLDGLSPENPGARRSAAWLWW
jgi:AcrR family transcriptional regulator